jgi:hypothetical protein
MKKGRNVCFGGGKGSAPDPNPGMLASADAAKTVAASQERIAKETLDFYKIQYDEFKPVLAQVLQGEVDIQSANKQRADEYAAYEKGTFRPVEQELVRQAKDYQQKAQEDVFAGQAAADVGTAFGVARGQQNRQLAASGIAPNSNRFAALNQQMLTQEALARAGAQNNARTMAQDKGTALMYDAAGLGRNLATNASTAYGVGLQAAQGARQSGMTGGQIMGQGFQGAVNANNGAIGGYGTAGNIYGQEFQGRMQGYQAKQEAAGALWKGVGGVIGGMASGGTGFFSSKDYKENKKPIKRGSALKALRNLDVEEWDYKPGYADGGHHVGPYSEDFKRETGAGDGKSITYQDALGLTMKSVQDLSDKVDRLEGAKKPIKRASGGMVRGPGGPVDDKIPAMLSNGEYVLPADTVQRIGKGKLDKLVDATHTPAAIQRKRKALKGKK